MTVNDLLQAVRDIRPILQAEAQLCELEHRTTHVAANISVDPLNGGSNWGHRDNSRMRCCRCQYCPRARLEDIMPVEGLPSVRTLAELYDIDKRYRTAGLEDAVLRQTWMRGAAAVVLHLVRFIQGDAPETNPDDPVARILEAWDAEVLRDVVKQSLRTEASGETETPKD